MCPCKSAICSGRRINKAIQFPCRVWSMFSIVFKSLKDIPSSLWRLIPFSPDTPLPSRVRCGAKDIWKRPGTKWTKFSQLSDWLYGQTCSANIRLLAVSSGPVLAMHCLDSGGYIISIFVAEDRTKWWCTFCKHPKQSGEWKETGRKQSWTCSVRTRRSGLMCGRVQEGEIDFVAVWYAKGVSKVCS